MVVEQRMTVEPWCWGRGVSHPLQLTTGLVVNSFVITSPTLAGERMLLIPKVSILSEQIYIYICSFYYKTNIVIPTCISDSALSLITPTNYSKKLP